MREHIAGYKTGDASSFEAFRRLVNLILELTVMAASSFPQLTQREGGRKRQLLSGPGGRPLLLNDGRYLRLTIVLSLEGTTDGDRLKVMQSSCQYQEDASGDQWVFRYDYLRHPGYQVPPGHLQVRGNLIEDCLDEHKALERIHFPTSRVSLEAIIRLLIRDFHIKPNTSMDIWNPILKESEHAFFEIAHKAVEGSE